MASSAPPAAPAEPRAAVTGWREALAVLLSSRLALMQLEAKLAARHTGQLAVWLAAAAFAMLCAWALLVAGGIAALAAATAWPWPWLALAAAAVHALAAGLCLWRATAASRPAFPITRAEFLKDREWLDTLKTPRKSNT